MSKEQCRCEFIDGCQFFKKFGSRQSNVWKAILNMYCTGHSKYLCEVYVKRQETGSFTAPNIMPSGQPVSMVFMQLP